MENKTVIEGKILGKVKGGFAIELGGVVAFLPKSQVDTADLLNMSNLIGTKDKDNGQTSTNYQNVSTVSVQINIESKELNEITYPIMSYSYSIGIAEDNPDIFREVYNSGTINGNGKTTIQIDRPITEYIDITKKNIIRIKVVAIDQAGGYKEETKLVEDLEEELQNASSVKDETRPKCKNITGAAEGNEWINAEAYQKRNKIRTIKTECVDGEGSQCIREYFNKSWPSDDQSEAEYSYIQVIDNAGNKSVEDEFVKADTCNKSNEENGCRVKINVDIKLFFKRRIF